MKSRLNDFLRTFTFLSWPWILFDLKILKEDFLVETIWSTTFLSIFLIIICPFDLLTSGSIFQTLTPDFMLATKLLKYFKQNFCLAILSLKTPIIFYHPFFFKTSLVYFSTFKIVSNIFYIFLILLVLVTHFWRIDFCPWL